MKCEYCENEVPMGASRCPSCGATVNSAMQSAASAPAAVQSAAPASGTPAAAKDRIVYIILGVVFGSIGVHNFYAGYYGRGIAQLLITILSCGWLFIVTEVWCIIEICSVTKDARGVPFK